MKTDAQLQHDVTAELESEPSIDDARIGVAVIEGIVTLTGFVESYVGKIAAERAARRVRGVRGLAEEIEVRLAGDPRTSDPEIARRILDFIKWDAINPDGAVDVKVEHGWVTLTGKVDWHFQRQGAYQDASRINGVKGVTNLIELRPRVTAADVKERIAAAYRRVASSDAAGVVVTSDGGTVTLSGHVHDWRDRDIAERAAWAAPGVITVVDRIVVT